MTAAPKPVPLSSLGAELRTPSIAPEELATGGPFWIVGASLSRGLDQWHYDRILFTVVPLEGDRAGVDHQLNLLSMPSRERLGMAVARVRCVGPCLLRLFRLTRELELWSFCEILPTGELWHIYDNLAGYDPQPGDPLPERTE